MSHDSVDDQTSERRKFAKLYESEKYNQILIFQEYDDETDMISLVILFENEEGGISRMEQFWDNTEQGWNESDQTFDKLGYAEVLALLEPVD